LHDSGPSQCFMRPSPDSCLLISVAPEKLAHLSHKFRATEEDCIPGCASHENDNAV
jgi:hypothetical protein